MKHKPRVPVVYRPIGDPSKQPKTAPEITTRRPLAAKEPCRFCDEVRKVVKKVAPIFFRG